MSHKRWSLREGSRHEDLALLEAITELCGTADSLRGERCACVRVCVCVSSFSGCHYISTDEVPSLLQMLLLFDHAQEARQLLSLFTELLDSAKTAVERAWPKQATPTPAPVTGPEATVNSMIASMATATEQSLSNNGE